MEKHTSTQQEVINNEQSDKNTALHPSTQQEVINNELSAEEEVDSVHQQKEKDTVLDPSPRKTRDSSADEEEDLLFDEEEEEEELDPAEDID